MPDPNNLGVTAGIDSSAAADVLAQRIAAVSQSTTPTGQMASGGAIDTEEALDRILAENAAAANRSPAAAYADVRAIDSAALLQARGEYAQLGLHDIAAQNSPIFKNYAAQLQQEARYRAGYADSPDLPPPDEYPTPGPTLYDSAKFLDRVTTAELNEEWTGAGRYDEIGGKDYLKERDERLRQSRYEAGYTNSADEKSEGLGTRLKDAFGEKDFAYAIAYGGLQTASSLSRATQPMLSGESYLPDQVQEQAATSLLPLAFSTIGTVGTLALTKNPNAALAAQYVSGAVGQGVEDAIDTYTSGHTFAQERAGQAISAGQGGRDVVNEVVESLRTLSPAAKELAETLTGLSKTGYVGNQAAGEFSQSQTYLGTTFGDVTQGEARFLGSSPFFASTRNTFLSNPISGLSRTDYLGNAAAAAMSGDYEGVKDSLAYAEQKNESDLETPEYRRDIGFIRREAARPWYEEIFYPSRVRAGIEVQDRIKSEPRYQPGTNPKGAHAQLQSDETDIRGMLLSHEEDEADISAASSMVGRDSTLLQTAMVKGGGASTLYRAISGISSDSRQGIQSLDTDISLNLAGANKYPRQRQFFLAQAAEDEKREASLAGIVPGLQKAAFDTGLGEEEAGFGLGMTRGSLSGASASSQLGGYNNQASYLSSVGNDPRNPLSPTERAGIEDNALRMRYTAANAVYDEENRDIARGRSIRDTDVTQREFLGSPGDVYAASIRALDSDQDQLRQNASERTRGNLTFAQRQGLDQQDVDLQSDLLIGPERARRSYYGAESELLGAAQSGDRAGLSRDLGLYGNSAFGLHNVFGDDQARVDNDYRDLSTSPNGSVAQKQAYARWRGDLQEQTENRDSSLLYRQAQSERVRDFQDEGSFRRSLLAPYLDGPDSNPLTRGNAVLGDLRRDLSGAQAALKATPQTSPAYEANAQRVEDFQNRIAQLEHERYSEMFSALPESIAGAPGSGILAGIVPTAAMTARFTSNPIFGGFGAPAPMPVSSVGGIQPGGTAGAFQTGSGAGSIEALLRELINEVKSNNGHMTPSAPWAGAGAAVATQQRTYNPARPPF